MITKQNVTKINPTEKNKKDNTIDVSN